MTNGHAVERDAAAAGGQAVARAAVYNGGETRLMNDNDVTSRLSTLVHH